MENSGTRFAAAPAVALAPVGAGSCGCSSACGSRLQRVLFEVGGWRCRRGLKTRGPVTGQRPVPPRSAALILWHLSRTVRISLVVQPASIRRVHENGSPLGPSTKCYAAHSVAFGDYVCGVLICHLAFWMLEVAGAKAGNAGLRVARRPRRLELVRGLCSV